MRVAGTEQWGLDFIAGFLCVYRLENFHGEKLKKNLQGKHFLQ
jgi:hypothetical protein